MSAGGGNRHHSDRPKAWRMLTSHRPRPNTSEASESAGGGGRTHTSLTGPRILSPVRLPVPPPRQVVQCVELFDFTESGLSSPPVNTSRGCGHESLGCPTRLLTPKPCSTDSHQDTMHHSLQVNSRGGSQFTRVQVLPRSRSEARIIGHNPLPPVQPSRSGSSRDGHQRRSVAAALLLRRLCPRVGTDRERDQTNTERPVGRAS